MRLSTTPDSYQASQAYARELMTRGANGVIYRSARRAGGECIACFRPRLVLNVRIDAHFEYRWEGSTTPTTTRLTTPARGRRSAGRPPR
jgi:hypothetical protein